MKKLLFLLLFTILFTNCSNTTNNIKKSNSQMADTETVLKFLETVKFKEKFHQKIYSIVPQLKKRYPSIKASLIDDFVKEVDLEYMMYDIVDIYKLKFTQNEMIRLNELYSSPENKKLFNKSRLIEKDLFGVGKRWGNIFAQEVIRKLHQKNKKRGCFKYRSTTKYEYCTPANPILKRNFCVNQYGKGWEDSGANSCRKPRTKEKSNYFYYPKTHKDCYDRNMKPIDTANGSFICKGND